jgi:hypothetical protein
LDIKSAKAGEGVLSCAAFTTSFWSMSASLKRNALYRDCL